MCHLGHTLNVVPTKFVIGASHDFQFRMDSSIYAEVLISVVMFIISAGFTNVQATVRNGQRWGSYRAFLRRAIDRPNLTIGTGATVQKVIIMTKLMLTASSETLLKYTNETLPQLLLKWNIVHIIGYYNTIIILCIQNQLGYCGYLT